VHATVQFHFFDGYPGSFVTPDNATLFGFEEYNSLDHIKTSKAAFINTHSACGEGRAHHLMDAIRRHRSRRARPTRCAFDVIVAWGLQEITFPPSETNRTGLGYPSDKLPEKA
jgi:hypothetical protein